MNCIINVGFIVEVAFNTSSRPCSSDVWVVEDYAFIGVEIVLDCCTVKLVAFPTTSLSCGISFLIEADHLEPFWRNLNWSTIWDGALAVLTLVIATRILIEVMAAGKLFILFDLIEGSFSILNVGGGFHSICAATEKSFRVVEMASAAWAFFCWFD